MTDAELKALAEKLSPGDIDSAPESGEYGYKETGKWYECPACDGHGEVEGATYCNFDELPLGVQFFGIGSDFKDWEAYFRAVRPAHVLSILADKAALADKVQGLEADLREAVRVAFHRGARQWTRLNYPAWFEVFDAEMRALLADEGTRVAGQADGGGE